MKTIDDDKKEEKELSDDDNKIEVVIDHEQSVQLEEAAASSVQMTALSVQPGGATSTESVHEPKNGLRVEAPPTSKRAVAFDLSSADSPGTESRILEEIWETDAKLRWTPSQQNVPPDVEVKYQEVADSSNSDLSEAQKQKIPTIAEKVEEKEEDEKEIEEHLSPNNDCKEPEIE